MPIPHDPLPDSTIALLREGYDFIPRRCRKYQTDIFETRLMLQPAICISGPGAAAQFYAPDRITRRHGMPLSTFTLIQDNGSVMALDGEAHRVRKAMFLKLMEGDAMPRLAALTERHWRERAARWTGPGRIVLLPEIEHILCAATAEWAGLTLSDAEAGQLAQDCAAMVDGTGSFGPRNWAGHIARGRVERRMQAVIRGIRDGTIAAPEGSAAAVIAHHVDAGGEPIDIPSAAVELINVIRAAVANARYIVFAAMAMHGDPELRERVRDADQAVLRAFAEEVRRYYPFIPFIGGRVLEPFTWGGRDFVPNDWVLMDLYGTNHDPRVWDDPGTFRLDRFLGREPDPFAFIPSGGGEHASGHRCPGEWITQTHIETGARLLAREMKYKLPAQDLRIDLARMPALPGSRFIVSDMKLAA